MHLPSGFIYLSEINSTIVQDIKYFSSDNFMGRPIKGYEKAECILTLPAAQALSQLQKSLLTKSLSLKIFDGYRPQMTVDEFIVWSQDPADQKMKKNYYPNINKADFFKLGYVAEKSSHTRGSTVDVTLVSLSSGEYLELNMGTRFDFMDELSHPLNPAIGSDAMNNRLLLRSFMQEAGFEPYDKEWWHFSFINEPYPDTYFNFPVA